MKHKLLLILAFTAFQAFGQSDSWQILETTNEASPRHENSFVECDGKFYALGGRADRPVEEFDPKTKTWKKLADVPMNFHHFQAISYDHEIYVIGAFTGGYPHEKPIPNFLIFNPKKNEWREGPEIPKDRLRGSVGVFVRNDKIYLASGIIDGHWDGHVTWFDEYDPKTGKWTVLPDAPRARDHFSATLVGDKAYLVGGRRSSAVIGKVLDLTVPEVDYFDFDTNTWHTIDSTIPTERAGTSNVANGPYLVVMNGESVAQEAAHAEVEMLDTRTGTWSSLPKLNQGRHGTGVVYYKGKIYVAAGSANRGGGPELNNIEVLEWK
ncbi:N-acetylneuraminic acid mutarotase [Algoriphagus iocasae]|jgi:N-acetylneuraminic acid mutarotase|uniref:N-acetylneuraminic acid mutarotase n=1 Tax=Algoriphagus iocasae TaxID=1836499 RepID=A0A841MAU6_9BACT|nr:kelch repeat-containing protein [Algoriphagus iocasae]MBB6325112.1 N-acetylneuraminic acid mutarotase [Algoriphagus iocasae]